VGSGVKLDYSPAGDVKGVYTVTHTVANRVDLVCAVAFPAGRRSPSTAIHGSY